MSSWLFALGPCNRFLILALMVDQPHFQKSLVFPSTFWGFMILDLAVKLKLIVIYVDDFLVASGN